MLEVISMVKEEGFSNGRSKATLSLYSILPGTLEAKPAFMDV